MIRLTANKLVGPSSEGTKTNPSSGDLMADSGAVESSGRYEARVSMGASAAALLTIQRRNAANDTTISAIPLRVPAGASSEFIWVYDLVVSERVRVVMGAALTGDGDATVQLEKLG